MKKEINIEIGQRVHVARKAAHLSRDELAEKLNISALFMGYIECGEKGMSLTTLQNLCNVLNVSADYILLGIDNSDLPRKNINIMLNNIEAQYLPLAEMQLRTLLYTIEELKKKSSDFSDSEYLKNM